MLKGFQGDAPKPKPNRSISASDAPRRQYNAFLGSDAPSGAAKSRPLAASAVSSVPAAQDSRQALPSDRRSADEMLQRLNDVRRAVHLACVAQSHLVRR